jgi:phage recombination protein Bet
VTTLADTCPICQAVHGQIDEFWACPEHGHQLQFSAIRHPATGEIRERYICPARKCAYERWAPRKPRTTTKGEPMTITHHPIAPSTELAIRDSQNTWDDAQRAALAQIGLRDAPDGDLAVFFHYCKAYQLDPFSHQATMIKRSEKRGDVWVDKWTIQTEIDGFRVIAHRAANRAGKIMSYPRTLWIDHDETEHKRWVKDRPPAGAEVTVMVDGHPFTAFASYREFVALDRNGKPTPMWVKMPANQIAKCAEAQALRKAFPRDLGDVVIPEETGQEAAGQVPPAQTPSSGEAEQAPARRRPTKRALTLTQQITAEFARLGVDDPDEQYRLVKLLAGLDEDHQGAINGADVLGPVLADLKQCTVYGDITERINTSATEQEGEPNG